MKEVEGRRRQSDVQVLVTERSLRDELQEDQVWEVLLLRSQHQSRSWGWSQVWEPQRQLRQCEALGVTGSCE